MNIIEMSSGLGNQMFQYALYCTMLEQGKEVKLNILRYRYRPSHNGYELGRVFGLAPQYATEGEVAWLADVSKDFWSDLRRKLGFVRRTHGTVVREEDYNFRYTPDIFALDNAYIQGWWQSEKYFLASAGTVRRAFRFQAPLRGRNLQWAEQIRNCLSVSVHVRRGNYMNKRNFASMGAVCTEKYYNNAVRAMRERLPETPVYFVFSDDTAWVKSNLDIPQAVYIEGNTAENAYIDMQLMSLCRHHIIANSSFSWWGAWLNPAPDKTVLAPAQWFIGRERPDVVPDNWTKIPIS